MNNLIYKTPVPEEKAREELKAFLEYFEREEGINNLRFFKAEDIVYDIVYWAEPVYDDWSLGGKAWYCDPYEQRCQKTYLINKDGTIEKVDEFEFFELQIWKVFERYPQKLLKTEYIVVAEINYNSATIYYTENTTAVQNKILRIICQQVKQKAQEFLAGR